MDAWTQHECDERSASEAELAIENERLHRQLAAVMELRTAELNEDNLYLINYLTEVCPPHAASTVLHSLNVLSHCACCIWQVSELPSFQTSS